MLALLLHILLHTVPVLAEDGYLTDPASYALYALSEDLPSLSRIL